MARPVATPSNDGILLVEGQDDLHTVLHLCDNDPRFIVQGTLNEQVVVSTVSDCSFCILDKKGHSELLKSVGVGVKVAGRSALGIVVDADENLAARWNGVIRAFHDTPYITVPDAPNPSGTIITGDAGVPRIGVWVMPDNSSSGELEDFVEPMIPVNDPVWPLSQGYIDSIRPEDRKFLPNKVAKAKVHAWLACRKNPRQMGAAIGAGDMEVHGSLCREFVSWLAKLFG